MTVGRVRTIEGSCWSCRKRRVKCDLTKPHCARCTHVGATCDYTVQPIRWCTRPTAAAPARYQVIPTVDEQLAASLEAHEKRALSYFRGRFWPLLTTTSEPCAPPVMLALEHRVLLLATCLVADTHRVLQDGRNSRRVPQLKRVECLSAVREAVNEYCSSGEAPSTGLLFAVLLLYFHDGYLECAEKSASTASHHAGAKAIMERLGGIEAVLDTGPEALHMLVSEFASTDLTTTMLKGGRPSFLPETWGKIDLRSVWWSRSPSSQFSLAVVLGQISSLVHYREDVNCGLAEISVERIRDFEIILTPTYAPFSTLASGTYSLFGSDSSKESSEAVDAYALTRSFQHAALIYLYRALCGLSVDHGLVQQHVLPCLDCILNIGAHSKVVNCALFPLLVAGTHVQSARHRRGVINVINSVHSEVKFASVQLIRTVLEDVWKSESRDINWSDMFAELGPDAAIL
ncbi:fungal-specific transcription factor domain-containing protein [Mariannaea sp. PMI_226]|nr:fungal-specific transcription factor domain-containing protein [Mariannaea sp. PMI_226]